MGQVVSKHRILVVCDHPFIGNLLKETLQNSSESIVEVITSSINIQSKLSAFQYSIIVLDSELKDLNWKDVINKIVSQYPQIPVVVLTDAGSVRETVEAMRSGAYDILEKPLEVERIKSVIADSLENKFIRTEYIRIATQPKLEEVYHGLVGRSDAMKKIFNLIERIKDSSVNILITGPSGSGKEMIAKALHQTSPRESQKFVAINCSAIPDPLLEGELFGYKKGAFTDARQDKVGLFEEAQKGTIFLDEIGDMPLTVQPKILRALQEREIRPLGALKNISIDVRIVAATNQDLQQRINEKFFREDLYYRLNAMQIELPALKTRPDDIPVLVDYFLKKFGSNHHEVKGVSQKAMRLLLDYSWPGNVRELENIIERACLLSKGEVILPEDLLFSKEENAVLPVSEWAKRHRSLDDIEKDYITEVLNSVSGNRSQAAKILGIGRKTLYNKLAKYDI